MPELDELLNSVAKTIATYREGEIRAPDAGHVARWLDQFSRKTQLDFLREFDHVIRESFIRREVIEEFLRNLVLNKDLAGVAPADFWRRVGVLSIQQNGQSQREMVQLFSEAVASATGVAVGSGDHACSTFVYLDDVLFTGNRIKNDLTAWIRDHAPNEAIVHVIVVAWYSGGQYAAAKGLQDVIRESKKSVEIKYWRSLELENRKYYRATSAVYWPSAIPDVAEVAQFMDRPNRFPLELRTPANRVDPFSSEQGRQILEHEFFVAGAKIISQIENWRPYIRPLGFSIFGVGFGATLITHRNCPNNCPLAMWWGDPEAQSGALKWYPLLPREGYSSPKNVFRAL